MGCSHPRPGLPCTGMGQSPQLTPASFSTCIPFGRRDASPRGWSAPRRQLSLERVVTMLGLLRWLGLNGKSTWRLVGKANRPESASRRRVFRSVILGLAELEDRVVPSLLGQQLFPSDYPWNQNIANAPVSSNSAAIIAHIG